MLFAEHLSYGVEQSHIMHNFELWLTGFFTVTASSQITVDLRCAGADVPRQRRASDDAAAGTWHDAADTAAVLPVQPDRLRHALARHLRRVLRQGEQGITSTPLSTPAP